MMWYISDLLLIQQYQRTFSSCGTFLNKLLLELFSFNFSYSKAFFKKSVSKESFKPVLCCGSRTIPGSGSRIIVTDPDPARMKKQIKFK